MNQLYDIYEAWEKLRQASFGRSCPYCNQRLYGTSMRTNDSIGRPHLKHCPWLAIDHKMEHNKNLERSVNRVD